MIKAFKKWMQEGGKEPTLGYYISRVLVMFLVGLVAASIILSAFALFLFCLFKFFIWTVTICALLVLSVFCGAWIVSAICEIED